MLRFCKNKDQEGIELKKKLIVNQENQHKDIQQMIAAIQRDISEFTRDSKSYIGDYELLKNIKITECLMKNNKTTLADYVNLNDLEDSKSSLENKKDILETKIEKLKHNSKTIKEIVTNLVKYNEDGNIDDAYKIELIKRLTNIYQTLTLISEQTGLSKFEEKPELLAKEDFPISNANTAEKKEYERMSIIVNDNLKKLEMLAEKCRAIHDQYVMACKSTFENIAKINIAIDKNEGERVKTLKSYEIFKREYRFFQTPKFLPRCYHESIYEIKRRIKFKKFLSYSLEKLRTLCEFENTKRRTFIDRNGLYMPKDLIPQLSFQAPFIK